MTINLQNRVAIVTGAGKGVGREHALLLARRGARVVVNDLGSDVRGQGSSTAAAQEVVDEIRAFGGEAVGNAASVTDFVQVQQMVADTLARWGKVDILVSNAGILRDKSFAKMELDDFRAVLDVHLMGAVHCIKAVWGPMQERNYGRIVLTTSSSGLFGNFGQSNYGAAKMALVGLMQTLALEGERHNIRVNCLAPSAATRMTAGVMRPGVFEALSASAVSPAVAVLSSENAPTRTVLCAGAGSFEAAHITLTRGLYLGIGPDVADRLAGRLAEVTDRCDDLVPSGAFAQSELEVSNAAHSELAGDNSRYVADAEVMAGRIADIGPEVATRDILRVGIIGAGTMGVGIAMNILNAGIPVTLLEVRQDVLDRGLATIRRNYEASASKGKLTAQQVSERMALIAPTLEYESLEQGDLIIEAVFEDYSAKETVFRKIDTVAKRGAILASNTSTLDINRIASYTGRPGDVLGLHFFSPANVMRLLEVVRGGHTAKDVLATCMALARRLGKVAVVSGVCDGFIGNRMILQYLEQAYFLLDEGVLPQQVDQAIEKFGFAMGPFRMSDLAGNDITWAIRKRAHLEHPERAANFSKAPDLVCELGRFGQKTGKGWYDYQPGDRTPHPSAEIEALLTKHSAHLNVRRTVGDEEIVQRLIYALVNEGAKILEEGIASRASDIDVVYTTGYGFPRERGGPMRYADSVGLTNVCACIQHFSKSYKGAVWKLSPLLARLADGGQYLTR